STTALVNSSVVGSAVANQAASAGTARRSWRRAAWRKASESRPPADRRSSSRRVRRAAADIVILPPFWSTPAGRRAPQPSGRAGVRHPAQGAGMARTRFGLHLTDFSHPAWAGAELLPRLTALCRVLEESDVFDTLWLPDHLHHLGPGGPGANRPESMMLLAAVAVPTSTLRLGLLVASAT